MPVDGYTAIANAVKATLEADAFFQVATNVKTIQVGHPGWTLQGDQVALFFAESLLPAIAINPTAAPEDQDDNTTNTIFEMHHVDLGVVTRGRISDLASGEAAHRAINDNIKRVLNAQKSTAKDLGIGGYVEAVVISQLGSTKLGDYNVIVSRMRVDIEITVEIE